MSNAPMIGAPDVGAEGFSRSCWWKFPTTAGDGHHHNPSHALHHRTHPAISRQPRASGAGMSTETAAVQAVHRQRRSRVPDSKRPRRQLGSWGWATSQGDVA
ncbi:MAG: hypothetical protein RKO68_02060 [Candidatus Accumulibacter sp.]|jgi:hypothetical protein|nr:hypothetical protein [Accumulibacter sp.]